MGPGTHWRLTSDRWRRLTSPPGMTGYCDGAPPAGIEGCHQSACFGGDWCGRAACVRSGSHDSTPRAALSIGTPRVIGILTLAG